MVEYRTSARSLATMESSNLSEYGDYLSKSFNAGELANKLLLETNNAQDSDIELETSIKRLDFDISDLNSKIDDNVRENSGLLIEEFAQVEKFKDEIKVIQPSVGQLNNSFQRLENEIIKPYNECVNLQMALKKVHQTNKLLRSLTFAIYLINKIEEIDKSENNLSVKPFKHLYSLSVLLRELTSYINNPSLKLIKLVRDYVQFSEILIKRCQNVIQVQTRNLLKFPIQEYVTNTGDAEPEQDTEKSLFNLLSSKLLLDEKNLVSSIELIYTASSKHSINLILRNLNNTKYLPSYINSLERPSRLIAQLERCIKSMKWVDEFGSGNTEVSVWDHLLSTNASLILGGDEERQSRGLLDRYWREIALGVDSGVREVVNRGGPIVRNLKNIKGELEKAIGEVVSGSYSEMGEPFKVDKLEYRMMLNSITNFERRK